MIVRTKVRLIADGRAFVYVAVDSYLPDWPLAGIHFRATMDDLGIQATNEAVSAIALQHQLMRPLHV